VSLGRFGWFNVVVFGLAFAATCVMDVNYRLPGIPHGPSIVMLWALFVTGIVSDIVSVATSIGVGRLIATVILMIYVLMLLPLFM
jgi:hypothetical protein